MERFFPPLVQSETRRLIYRSRRKILLTKILLAFVIISLIFTIHSLVTWLTPRQTSHPDYSSNVNFQVMGKFFPTSQTSPVEISFSRLNFIQMYNFTNGCGPYQMFSSDYSTNYLWPNITSIGCIININYQYSIKKEQKENYQVISLMGFLFDSEGDIAFVSSGNFDTDGNINDLKTNVKMLKISGYNNFYAYIALGYNNFKGYEYEFWSSLSFTASFTAPLWAILSISINWISRKIRHERGIFSLAEKDQTLMIDV